ncbi:MAG: hypothetical protein Q8K82_01075 [Gemmatimonadaceae bacterium]|nr:hypothetical protein [Gemmatimonadaceae bacterium]
MANASNGGLTNPATSAITGSDGRAQFSWTLGNVVGQQTLTFSTPGAAEAKVVTATAKNPTSARVEIRGGRTPIEDSETLPLSAVLFGTRDQEITGRACAWSSSNPLAATVSPAGPSVTVTGVAPGQVAIIVLCDGRTATFSLTVVSTAVALVETTPTALTLSPGWTAVVTGRPKNARGAVMSVPLDSVVTSSATTASVAKLSDGTGRVTGVAVGPATVALWYKGKASAPVPVQVVLAAVKSVEVSPNSTSLTIGQNTTAFAVLKDAQGFTLSGRTCAWVTTDPTILTVTASTNTQVATVTAIAIPAAGSPAQLVNATCESVSDLTPPVFDITNRVASKIELDSLWTTPVERDDSIRVWVRATATDGASVRRPIAWSTIPVGSATILDPTALSGDTVRVAGVTVGTTTLIATVDGKADSIRLSVLAPIHRTTDITLVTADAARIPADTVFALDSLIAHARKRDKRGRPILHTSAVVWDATNNGVLRFAPYVRATLDSIYVVGSLIGSATVSAVAGSIAAPGRAVQTKQAPVRSIAIFSSDTIALGQASPVNAQLKDHRGRDVGCRPVAWGTRQPAVISVSGNDCNATITGVSVGRTTIIAVVGKDSAFKVVEVTLPQPNTQGARIVGIFLPGTSTPVNLSSVSAVVDVAVTMTPASAAEIPTSVTVEIGGILMSTLAIVPGSCALSVPCNRTVSVPTDSFSVSATARTPLVTNGSKAIQAKFLSPGPVKLTNTVSVNLNNQDGFVVLASAPVTSALDASGRLWFKGNVSGSIFLVAYSGKTLQSVNVRFGTGPAVAATAGTPFTASIPNSGYSSAGAALESISIVSGIYTDASATPVAFAANGAPLTTMRIDNQSPSGTFDLVGGAASTRWINATYDYATGLSGVADAGVGMPATVTATYESSGCGSTAWTSFTGSAGSIGECATILLNTAYSARVIVADRLGNAGTLTMPSPFGVDVTPPGTPTFTASSLADNSIFIGTPPATLFDITIPDTRSGGATASIPRWLAHTRPGRSVCGPGTGTPGTQPITSPTCVLGDGPSAVGMPSGETVGWVVYKAQAKDLAGNLGPTVTRRAMIEQALPNVGPVTTPPTPDILARADFGLNIADDVELREAGIFFRRPALSTLVGGGDVWLGYPIPEDSASNNYPTLPLSDPFDDNVSSALSKWSSGGIWPWWIEPASAFDSVQPPAAYSGAMVDALFARATDQRGTDVQRGVSGFSALPTVTSWDAWNTANPNDKLLAFKVNPSINTGGAVWGIYADLFTPLTSAVTPILRIDWFLMVPYAAPNATAVWCYIASSSGATRIPGTTARYSYRWSGGGSAAPPTRRSCVGAANITLVEGATILPVAIRSGSSAIAIKPFLVVK